MHTLLLFKEFRPKTLLTINGRKYKPGVPLAIYINKAHATQFIQEWDGPFLFIKNADYYRRLRAIGIREESAIKLSGWHPPAPQSFTDPVKTVVMPAPQPMVGATQTTSLQQNTTHNTQLDMAKKNKPAQAPATPTPAPAAAVPPPPGAPAAVPPPPGAPAPVPAPAAPAAPAKPKEPEQNGVTRPSEGTTTRTVWDRADSLTTQSGSPATRKAVVDACSALGINSSTATTQFGKWAKFHGHVGVASPGRAAAPAAPAPSAPVPAPGSPAADVDPAFQAGVDGYARAVAGESVTNPYTAGSAEADAFTNGWQNAAAAAAQ